jgi:hypothetical protein
VKAPPPHLNIWHFEFLVEVHHKVNAEAALRNMEAAAFYKLLASYIGATPREIKPVFARYGPAKPGVPVTAAPHLRAQNQQAPRLAVHSAALKAAPDNAISADVEAQFAGVDKELAVADRDLHKLEKNPVVQKDVAWTITASAILACGLAALCIACKFLTCIKNLLYCILCCGKKRLSGAVPDAPSPAEGQALLPMTSTGKKQMATAPATPPTKNNMSPSRNRVPQQAIEATAEFSADLEPGEYDVVFGPGSMGLYFAQDSRGNFIVSRATGQSDVLGVQLGSKIMKVNDLKVVTTEQSMLVSILKHAQRPVRIVFVAPQTRFVAPKSTKPAKAASAGKKKKAATSSSGIVVDNSSPAAQAPKPQPPRQPPPAEFNNALADEEDHAPSLQALPAPAPAPAPAPPLPEQPPTGPPSADDEDDAYDTASAPQSAPSPPPSPKLPPAIASYDAGAIVYDMDEDDEEADFLIMTGGAPV